MSVSTTKPQPYVSPHNPLLHSGVVAVTGTLDVDLGIGHTNFIVNPVLKSAVAGDANAASAISWDYVSGRPGVFRISCWKATAAGTTTLIAATAAVNVSFTALAGASVA